MVVWSSPALLAVAALVAARTDTAKQQRRCRRTLTEALDGLDEVARIGPQAGRLVRTACKACARCPGV